MEFLFNTPSHHRVHQASNLIAITLVLSASGTGCLALSSQIKQEPPVYGLTSNLATCHPCIVLSHEYAALWQDFKRADNWRDKLTYLLLAPDWRHDGPVKRARVLRTRAALATGRFIHAL